VTPFRVTWIAAGCGLDDAVIRRYLAHSQRFPRAERGVHEHPVAVCGGGPSLDAHLDELRAWPGDIWAVNWTADYLLDRGIDCTMLTVDPLITETTAAKRLIATCCDPRLFTGDVRCFAISEYEEDGVPGGSTTAGRAPTLALRLGYPGAVFFGCDSSFEDRDHVDRNEQLPDALLIEANGRVFKTYPELSMQAEALSALLREFPQFLQSKSGGLLDAMTKDPNWSVVAVSTALKQTLIDTNGDTGLYDEPYACKECGQTQGHYDDCPVGLGVSE
jgi:hypothetical protein